MLFKGFCHPTNTYELPRVCLTPSWMLETSAFVEGVRQSAGRVGAFHDVSGGDLCAERSKEGTGDREREGHRVKQGSQAVRKATPSDVWVKPWGGRRATWTSWESRPLKRGQQRPCLRGEAADAWCI